LKLATGLRTAKLVAQVVAAIASAIVALVALSPVVRRIWAVGVSEVAPYIGFLRPYAFLAGIVSLALFFYLVVTLYNSWKHRFALLTSLENHILLDLHDDTGKKADFSQSVLVRADVNDVEVYQHRIVGDGTYTTPAIRAEGSSFRVEGPVVVHGLDCYDLRFVPPLPRGRLVRHYFECTFENSFTGTNESFDHLVDYREKLIVMEILFPAKRHPKTASAHLIQGLIKTKIANLDPVDADDGRKRVVWRMKKPELGRSYRIEWEW